MPGSTLSSSFSSSSSVFGSHSGMSRAGIESSLIVNKVQSTLNDSSKMTVDSALLQLELKRHERKRHLMRYGDFDFNNDERSAAASLKKLEEAKKAQEDQENNNSGNGAAQPQTEEQIDKYAKDLEQWVKKMRCSGATGVKIDNFKEIKVGVLSDEVAHKAPSLEPYPAIHKLEHKFRGGKDKNGLYVGKGVVEFENGDTITGFFKVCRHYRGSGLRGSKTIAA